MALFYVHDLPANMQWRPEADQPEAPQPTSETATERPVASA